MNTQEIYSDSFPAGRRTYFIDIKLTEKGDKYLKITESKKDTDGGFERHQIMVFKEDIEKFTDAVAKAAWRIREPETPSKSYSLDDKRKAHQNAYKPWTEQDDHRLELLYCEGKTIKEVSEIFNRNPGAIRSRIEKLDLKRKYGEIKE